MFGSDLDHLLNENKITIQCGFDVKVQFIFHNSELELLPPYFYLLILIS